MGPGESTYARYDADIAADAVRWLSEAPKGDKPWVLFVSFVCPHFPLIAPPDFYRMYPEEQLPWPEFYDQAARPAHPYYKAMWNCINYDRQFTDEKVRKAVTGYMGLCSYMDHNVGQVLDAIEANGLGDDTRVIYTSDHGEALGKRGLWDKSTMFEESAAIPMILAGPGVGAGMRVATPVSLVDCHQTILHCVGAAPAPEDADLPGTSLFSIAEGAEPDRAVFSEYHAAAKVTAIYPGAGCLSWRSLPFIYSGVLLVLLALWAASTVLDIA